MRQPHDGTGDATSYRTVRFEYDEVGNRTKVVSPRGEATSDPNDFTEGYVYDELNRVKEQILPYDPADECRRRVEPDHDDRVLPGRQAEVTLRRRRPGRPRQRAGRQQRHAEREPTGTWTPAGDWTGFQGFDFARHDTGVPGDAFTWRLNVPSDGKYDVSVRYPTGGTATNAKYTVKYRGGEATKQVDQTHGGGQWVSLGSFDLADGTGQAVTVSADADGAVLADAVRIIRDNSGDVDTEEKSYGYSYDANGNLTTLTDHSSGAVVRCGCSSTGKASRWRAARWNG